MFKRLVKKDNGSITIEACISLSAFMFTIVTILTIVNICIVQARMAISINTIAKEISQYSYLYSLTGFNKSEQELSKGAEGARETINSVAGDIDSIMTDVNTVFNEIEKLGNPDSNNLSLNNIGDIAVKWDEAVGVANNISNAGSSLEKTVNDIASNPKDLMFGIAKLAASEGLDLAKSRLVAAPLAKTLCKKHLKTTENGNVEAYLKHLGVVPGANGSYLDGLDFTQSTIFPSGSNEITINVAYDVKVIALLPINYSFHFNQTAITHGWLAGEASYKESSTFVENETLWTEATIHERSQIIKNMGIKDLKDEGYYKTKGLTDVQMYNPDKNEFVMFASMNPLYSGSGEEMLTLDDIDPIAIENSIELLCGKIKSTTDGLHTVTTKNEKSNGETIIGEYSCSNAANKIVLTIPEDEGLKEIIEGIIAKADTKGVSIEVITNYGTGVNKKEVGGSE